jgi:hypothetical protein
MILSSTTLSGVTEKPSLFEDIDFNCGSDSGNYTSADKLRNINKALHRYAVLAWQSDGNWSFDDGRHVDLPIATTTLVNGQRDYSIPTDLLKIERVSYLNLDGKYVDLELIDKRDMPELMNEDAGTPIGYWLLGSSLFLYPKPNTSLVATTSGLRIVFKREIKEFTNADASVSLGIPETHASYISLVASLDYCRRNDMDRYVRIKAEILEMEELIKNDYSKRNTSKNARISGKYVSYE